MMVAHDRAHGAQRAEPRAQCIADDRMLAHHPRLLGVERAALEQHAIGDGDLADVVQEAAALERGEIAIAKAKRAAERDAVRGEPLAMPARRRIARLDGGAEAENQRLDRLELVRVELQAYERADARAQLSH